MSFHVLELKCLTQSKILDILISLTCPSVMSLSSHVATFERKVPKTQLPLMLMAGKRTVKVIISFSRKTKYSN